MMKKIPIILIAISLFACNGTRSTEEMVVQADVASDTTTDPVADTTKAMLDNLGDSIRNMQQEAAGNAP